MYYKTKNITTNYSIFSSENLDISRVLLEREREREYNKNKRIYIRRYNSSRDYYTLLYYSIQETLIPDREKYPG